MSAPRKTVRDVLLVRAGPDPEQERKIADEKLCLRLLAGYSVDDGKVGFPQAGSAEEWAARAALARIIREYVKGFVGEYLALAIDPRTPSRSATARPIRFVRFDKPRGSRPPTTLRDLLIVGFIRERLRELGKEDAALRAAEQKFALRKSRVHKIWSRHKKRVGIASKRRPARRPARRSTK